MSRPIYLSLVMPAFNEADGIEEAVAEAHESLIGLGYEFEILVIDDGSTDATVEIAGKVAALWPRVRVLSHDRNLGYGAALRTGFEAARYDLIAFTDADGQFYLDDIDELSSADRRAPRGSWLASSAAGSMATAVLVARLQPACPHFSRYGRPGLRLCAKGISPR